MLFNLLVDIEIRSYFIVVVLSVALKQWIIMNRNKLRLILLELLIRQGIAKLELIIQLLGLVLIYTRKLEIKLIHVKAIELLLAVCGGLLSIVWRLTELSI